MIMHNILKYPMDAKTGEYTIPDEDKKEILERFYPFRDVPGLDKVLYDMHEGKTFVCRDYKLVWISDMQRNLVYSPYYLNSGGSAIDWRSEGYGKAMGGNGQRVNV